MSAAVVPAGSQSPRRSSTVDSAFLRRLVAVLILTSWVAWALPAWQSSLDEVTAQELLSDIEADRVVGFMVVDNVRRPSVSWLGGLDSEYDAPASDASGRPEDGFASQLLYTTRDDVRTHWVPDLLVDGPDPLTVLLASDARHFRDAGAPPRRGWALYPALLITLLVLGSLAAMAPRRGTRPFWILVGFLPAGLGLLAYAVCELAAAPPAPLAGPAQTNRPRLRGGHGLVIAVIGGLLLPGLLRQLT